MSAPLSDCRIWLTRAAHQAAPWRDTLQAAGAQVVCEPLLAIDAPTDPAQAAAALARAEHTDVVIATSTNAVRAAWQLRPEFAPAGQLLAIGAATAAALEQASGRAVTRPNGAFDSETLLDRAALNDLQGRRVALLSGEGGRRVLRDTLSARGAAVDKIALYRRRWLTLAPERLAEVIGAVDVVIVTSGEALSHLADLVAGEANTTLRARLSECRLVAPSTRVVKQTQQRLSWTHEPVIVERFGGEAIAAALARVWTGNRQ